MSSQITVFAQINQLHWHIVDSQSFPLQVPGFLEISQKGAYDASSVYTPSDVKDIVSFAAAVSLFSFTIRPGFLTKESPVSVESIFWW